MEKELPLRNQQDLKPPNWGLGPLFVMFAQATLSGRVGVIFVEKVCHLRNTRDLVWTKFLSKACGVDYIWWMGAI